MTRIVGCQASKALGRGGPGAVSSSWSRGPPRNTRCHGSEDGNTKVFRHNVWLLRPLVA